MIVLAVLLLAVLVGTHLHNRDGPRAQALAWVVVVASGALVALGAVSLVMWWRG